MLPVVHELQAAGTAATRDIVRALMRHRVALTPPASVTGSGIATGALFTAGYLRFGSGVCRPVSSSWINDFRVLISLCSACLPVRVSWIQVRGRLPS